MNFEVAPVRGASHYGSIATNNNSNCYGQSPLGCASSPMSSSGSSMSDWSIYDQQSLSPSSPPSSTTSSLSSFSSHSSPSLNQTQPENLDQIETMARKECLKEIDMACHLLTISADPYNWTVSDVCKWLRWVHRTNQLPTFKLDYFQISGATLCNLTESEFKQRAPNCGDILYAKLDIWRWALNYGTTNILESLFDSVEQPTSNEPMGNCTPQSIPNRNPCSMSSPVSCSEETRYPNAHTTVHNPNISSPYGSRDFPVYQQQSQQCPQYGPFGVNSSSSSSSSSVSAMSPVPSPGSCISSNSSSYSRGSPLAASMSPEQQQLSPGAQYTICINNNFIFNDNRRQQLQQQSLNYPGATPTGYQTSNKLSYPDSTSGVGSMLATSDYGSEGVSSDADDEISEDGLRVDYLPIHGTHPNHHAPQYPVSAAQLPSYSSKTQQQHSQQQFQLPSPVPNYPMYPSSPNTTSSSSSSTSQQMALPNFMPYSKSTPNIRNIAMPGPGSSASVPVPVTTTPTVRPPGSSGSHIHLWQFLKELLSQPQHYGSSIRWLDRSKGVFKIEDSVRVARLWGARKNRPAMNYDKLSRSIRQYYKKGIMKKTERSQRLVYQFCTPYCF